MNCETVCIGKMTWRRHFALALKLTSIKKLVTVGMISCASRLPQHGTQCTFSDVSALNEHFDTSHLHSNPPSKKQLTTRLHLSCYKNIGDQCTQVKELKKWFASSKATDGMLYYCVKRGCMTKKKYRRHITNTFFMGAGKYDNKHGVGILLNKKWKQKIIDTEYINERAISTTIVVNRQRIKLMSVYFSHTTSKKMQNDREAH